MVSEMERGERREERREKREERRKDGSGFCVYFECISLPCQPASSSAACHGRLLGWISRALCETFPYPNTEIRNVDAALSASLYRLPATRLSPIWFERLITLSFIYFAFGREIIQSFGGEGNVVYHQLAR